MLSSLKQKNLFLEIILSCTFAPFDCKGLRCLWLLLCMWLLRNLKLPPVKQLVLILSTIAENFKKSMLSLKCYRVTHGLLNYQNFALNYVKLNCEKCKINIVWQTCTSERLIITTYSCEGWFGKVWQQKGENPRISGANHNFLRFCKFSVKKKQFYDQMFAKN
jgi:hypothetical protein